jgi:DNA-binding transcriptional LysR family regulator
MDLRGALRRQISGARPCRSCRCFKEQLFVRSPEQQCRRRPNNGAAAACSGEMDLYLAVALQRGAAGWSTRPSRAAGDDRRAVVAEIESASTLTSVIAEGLGVTILPRRWRARWWRPAMPGSAASSIR